MLIFIVNEIKLIYPYSMVPELLINIQHHQPLKSTRQCSADVCCDKFVLSTVGSRLCESSKRTLIPKEVEFKVYQQTSYRTGLREESDTLTVSVLFVGN